MKILVTGAAGFIGSHFVDHLLRMPWKGWNFNPDTDVSEIIILDKLTYASSGFDRLREVGAYDNSGVKIYPVDLTKPMGECLEKEIGDVDYIVHMAAETHVDNSITGPRVFVESNVLGTFEVLEFARRQKHLKKMIYFSTDEVFGPAPGTSVYGEWDRYNSTNPYSATKAAGEELCLAWANTYKVPVLITHTMNVFGERQHPEKFIPKTISKVLKGETVQIHASADKKVSGSRFYIHARNVGAAVLFLMERGLARDKYNIVGEREVTNLDLARFIAAVVGKPLVYEMVDFHSSRPGHDLRYGLDGQKLRWMGWNIPKTFEDSLTKTIQWTLENPRWLS